MPYAVELLFDAATEAALRRLITGENTAHRPHVSLGGCRSLRDRNVLIRSLQTLADEQAGPLPVTLACLGVFPGDEGIVFYGVTVTTGLLLLHRRFHAAFTPQASDWSPFYEPGVWVPHCTLAYGLMPERLPEALALLQSQLLPSLSGLLTGIALVEIPSGEEITVFAFSSA